MIDTTQYDKDLEEYCEKICEVFLGTAFPYRHEILKENKNKPEKMKIYKCHVCVPTSTVKKDICDIDKKYIKFKYIPSETLLEYCSDFMKKNFPKEYFSVKIDNDISVKDTVFIAAIDVRLFLKEEECSTLNRFDMLDIQENDYIPDYSI